MKLNYAKELVKRELATGSKQHIVAKELREDWITLDAECTKQATLIEQLERALKYAETTIITKAYWRSAEQVTSALSAVSEWRKEQG